MTSIQTILAPVDLSKGAQRSIREAALIASKFKAKLLLLHAEPKDGAEADYRGEGFPGEQEAYELDELAHLASNEAPDAVSEVLTISGNVPDAVRQVAAERHVDLVVMSTRGKGAYQQFTLGRNTKNVLRDSACPVLTGAHLEHPPEACHTYRRIACLLDMKEGSTELLQQADAFAKVFGATLTVVHVPPNFSSGAGLHKEFSQALISSARLALEDLLEKTGVKAQIAVKVGLLEELLPPLLDKGQFDLLVIGRDTGAKPDAPGRPSANAYTAICCSPCPVLSF